MKTKKMTHLGVIAACVILVSSCMTSNRNRTGYNIQFRGGTGSNEISQSKSASDAVQSISENQAVPSAVASQVEAAVVAVSNNDMPLNNQVQQETTNSLVSQNDLSTKNLISNFAKNQAKGQKLTLKEKVALKLIAAKAGKVVSTESKSSKQPENWVYWLLMLLVPFGTTIAMYLYEGSWTSRVTANLLWTLLCGLPGLIHAIIIIAGKK